MIPPIINLNKGDATPIKSFSDLIKLDGRLILVNSKNKGDKLIGKLKVEGTEKEPNFHVEEGMIFREQENGAHIIQGQKYRRATKGRYGINTKEEFNLREPYYIHHKTQEIDQKIKQLSEIPSSLSLGREDNI